MAQQISEMGWRKKDLALKFLLGQEAGVGLNILFLEELWLHFISAARMEMCLRVYSPTQTLLFLSKIVMRVLILYDWNVYFLDRKLDQVICRKTAMP